jgi:predicted outer membrane protein
MTRYHLLAAASLAALGSSAFAQSSSNQGGTTQPPLDA